MDFESLIAKHRDAVERFVYYRMPSKADGDDVLGEVYLAAYKNFGLLRDYDAFKSWILSIARNKCNDYFRLKAKCREIPMDDVTEQHFGAYRHDCNSSPVVDTLKSMRDDQRTVLWRRFNRDDWAVSRYGKIWSEQLPDNARLNVNGEVYVHWYDCITDYIV